MILTILLFALCIVSIMFFTNKNKENNYNKQREMVENENKKNIQNYYSWLKNKDVLTYHELYNKTLELLKSETHEDFFIVFNKFFLRKR